MGTVIGPQDAEKIKKGLSFQKEDEGSLLSNKRPKEKGLREHRRENPTQKREGGNVDKIEAPAPTATRKPISRIAPHAGRMHLDEVAAIGFLSLFPEEAERVWPGSSTANMRPMGQDEDVGAVANDETVLKLGWTLPEGIIRDDFVDEHSLPESQRQNQCVATLVVERLSLSPRQMFLVEPILKEVLAKDKTGKQPQNELHLGNIVQKAIEEDEFPAVVDLITYAMKLLIKSRERYLFTRENVAPSAVWTVPYQGKLIEVHIVDPSDRYDELRDVVVANRHNHGASLVVLRDSKGHVQVIDPGNKFQEEMASLAALVRSREIYLAGATKFPSLRELRQTGTVADPNHDNPRWHFSDSRNLLNGGEARPWTPATQIPLEGFRVLITHALDQVWMKTWETKHFS